MRRALPGWLVVALLATLPCSAAWSQGSSAAAVPAAAASSASVPYDRAVVEATLLAGKAASAKARANLQVSPLDAANLTNFYSKLQGIGAIAPSIRLPSVAELPANKRDLAYLSSLNSSLGNRPFIWLPDRTLQLAEYPQAVAILEYSVSPLGQVSLHNKCSGTVIAPTIVLSAAHCVCDMTHKIAIHVATSDWMLDAGKALDVVTSRTTVADCAAFRQADIAAQRDVLRNAGDVAVFVVKEDITTFGIQPARVVDGFRPSSSYYIAGYGISDSGREGPRRSATIQGMLCDQARATAYGCNPEFEFWGDGGRITGRQDRADACGGDSGGPVFDTSTVLPVSVIGVISRPINGTSCGQGAIYVALKGRILTWLQKAVSEQLAQAVVPK
jgi:hypothetical protein